MQSVENKVLKRIYAGKRGMVFTPPRFFDLGTENSIRKALQTLSEKGVIRRLGRGLYDYPASHPKLGLLSPTPEQIAAALAGKDKARIQPSGAYAANLLGLTLQVPAQVTFLTDGATRTVSVGNQTITLKRTTPKNMAAAGRISGLVIQALRYLGQKNVNQKVIETLDRRLITDDRKTLLRDIKLAPAWIGEIIRQLAAKED